MVTQTSLNFVVLILVAFLVVLLQSAVCIHPSSSIILRVFFLQHWESGRYQDLIWEVFLTDKSQGH